VIAFGIPDLSSTLDLPESTPKLVIILVAIGFPIALVLAWAYEVKPEEPTPSEPSEEETAPSVEPAKPAEVTATDQRKSIVVLPFDNMSPDPGG
jgi:hypothetical protein